MLGAVRFRWVTSFLDFPADVFEPGVAFWREVTGSGLSPLRGASGEFATLLPVIGDAYLRVQRAGAGPGGCHLDLHVDTQTESLHAAAGRAATPGATVRHAEDGLAVADSPGGFTFCLVEREGESVVPEPVRLGDAGASRADQLCLDIPAAGFEREWACADRRRLADAHVAAGARVLSAFPHWIVLADPAAACTASPAATRAPERAPPPLRDHAPGSACPLAPLARSPPGAFRPLARGKAFPPPRFSSSVFPNGTGRLPSPTAGRRRGQATPVAATRSRNDDRPSRRLAACACTASPCPTVGARARSRRSAGT